jgi:hypothetical protein
MLNQDQFTTLWPQIKSGLQNVWEFLDDDKLERTNGDLSAIATIVQEKTGEDRSQIKEKLDQLLASFDNETDKGIDPDVTSYQRSPVIPVNEEWTPRH